MMLEGEGGEAEVISRHLCLTFATVAQPMAATRALTNHRARHGT